jgi:hypothetical protein
MSLKSWRASARSLSLSPNDFGESEGCGIQELVRNVNTGRVKRVAQCQGFSKSQIAKQEPPMSDRLLHIFAVTSLPLYTFFSHTGQNRC